MTVLLLALSIGVIAGLRAMTAPGMVGAILIVGAAR